MDKIFKSFDKVLSLGTNCFVKSFMQYNNISQETNFFDHIGSPMWGICDLVENGFQHLSEQDDYDKLHITNNLDIFSNKRYYLRLKHDDHIYKKQNMNYKTLNNMFLTLERRGARFVDLLKTLKNILFIRLEQDDSKRISYEEYKVKNN